MDDEDYKTSRYRMLPHYYGNTVRALFISAGVLMMVFLPIFKDELQIPLPLAVFGVVVVVIMAGLVNPAQQWTAVLSSLISFFGLIVFEYQAIFLYKPELPMLFVFSQVVAVVFFFALYFSLKTVRGRFIH